MILKIQTKLEKLIQYINKQNKKHYISLKSFKPKSFIISKLCKQ